MFLLPSLAYVCSSPQYRGQGENVANNQSGCVTFYVNEVITVDLAVFCGFFWLHFWRFLCIQQDWRFVVFYCFLLAVFLFILYLQKLYTDFLFIFCLFEILAFEKHFLSFLPIDSIDSMCFGIFLSFNICIKRAPGLYHFLDYR